MSIWQLGLLGRYWHGGSRENDLTRSRENNRAKNSLVHDAGLGTFVSRRIRDDAMAEVLCIAYFLLCGLAAWRE